MPQDQIAMPIWAAPVIAALFVAGCVPPPAKMASVRLADASTVSAEQSLATDAPGEWPAEEWWRSFGDPQLDALIEEGMENAPSLAAAMARFRRANGLAKEAGAALYPQLDANGEIYEDRRSLNNGFGSGIKQFLPRGWRTGGDVTASAGLDIDLWGRNRAMLAAATSEARAAAIDAEAARLILASAIADAYADLGQLFTERDIRQAALDIRLAIQRLVANREADGLETRGSLRQADAQVATARVMLTRADEDIALRRHQIAALLGAGPDRGLTIERPALMRATASDLPQGVTTGLIARRPDIASARERAEAAARRVKAARADFFPAIRLDALIGFQSIGLSTLFQSDSTIGSVGPAVSLPIFHGGALEGRHAVASAAFDEAVADYDHAVIVAYREVADIVTSRAATGSKLTNARVALDASEDAYRIARLRYEGGLSDYLDVLTVEDRLLEARLAVAGLETGAHLLDIALFRALGGGFGADCTSPAKDNPHG